MKKPIRMNNGERIIGAVNKDGQYYPCFVTRIPFVPSMDNTQLQTIDANIEELTEKELAQYKKIILNCFEEKTPDYMVTRGRFQTLSYFLEQFPTK